VNRWQQVQATAAGALPKSEEERQNADPLPLLWSLLPLVNAGQQPEGVADECGA
jgi:hypothetical protein